MSIHVSYDRDDESPLVGSDAPPGNESQEYQQPPNIDGSVVHGEDAVDSEGVKPVDGLAQQEEVSAGQPAIGGVAEKGTEQPAVDQVSIEPSKQAPAESHAEDTVEQRVQDEVQTERQTEETTTQSSENEDKP